MKYDRSKYYGNYAVKLFQSQNKKQRSIVSGKSPARAATDLKQVNKTPGPISKPIAAQRYIANNELTFDTPKGKERKLGSVKSEVDFIMGGGRPSAMTIDLPNTASRKTSLNSLPK